MENYSFSRDPIDKWDKSDKMGEKYGELILKD
jgi:hypothetical protein